MGNKHDAPEMFKRTIDAFSDDGKLSLEELDHILEAALQDGEFQKEEKRMLIDLISQLNAADFTPEIWDRIVQLVHEHGLDEGV